MSLVIGVAICASLAITLAICVYLFLSVKRDLHILEARYLRRGEDLRTKLNEVAEELKTVRQQMEMMEQRADPSAAVARTLGSGTRIQALRMIRQGQGPEHISAALGLPRNEVELLIKVQRLMSDDTAQPTT